MRSAPLVLVGIALCVATVGFWLLASPAPEAPREGVASLITDTEPSATPQDNARHGIGQGAVGLAPPAAEDAYQTVRDVAQVSTPEQPRDSNISKAEEAAPPPPPETKRLVGRVKPRGASDQVVLKNVSVSAFGDKTALAGTQTLGDGSFVIDIPDTAKQPLKLLFDSPRTYPQEVYLGVPTRAKTDLGWIQLAQSSPLRGKITTSEGLAPTAAWGRALPQDAYTPAIDATVDAAGSFSFSKVDEHGFIFIGAKGQQVLEFQPFQLRSLALSDPEGLAHVQLEPGNKLVVGVFDVNQKPVARADVQLLPAYPFASWERKEIKFENAALYPTVLNAKTNGEGLAHFDQLGDDRYFARVQAMGKVRGFETVVKPAVDTDISFTLESAPLAKFRVLGFDKETGHGLPIKGIRAGLLSINKRQWNEFVVNGKGDVSHYMNDEDPWLIEAWAPGYRVQTEPMIPAAAPDAPPQVVLLFPAKTDLLHVVNQEGLPIKGASLVGDMMSKARRNAGVPRAEPWNFTPHEVSEGVFELPRFSEDGAEIYQVSAPGLIQFDFGVQDWPKPAKESRPDASDLLVTLAPECPLSVSVYQEDGSPSVGARVFVIFNALGNAKPWVTNSKGDVQVTGLGPGRVTVRAISTEGAISNKEEVRLTDNSPTRVVLSL